MKNIEKFADFFEKFTSDPAFRDEMEKGNQETLAELHLDGFEGELIIKTNTNDTVYFIILDDINHELGENEAAHNIAGAKHDSNDPDISYGEAQGEIALGGLIFGFGALDEAEKIIKHHPEYFYENTIILKLPHDYYSSLPK